MAQREIYNFLQSKPNEIFSAKKISKELNLDLRVVTKDVRQLGKYNIIDLHKDKKKFTFGIFTKK